MNASRNQVGEDHSRTADLAYLQKRVREFTDERGWRPAHDAKNLAMSIAIESAELMEHFQWGDRDAYHPDQMAPEQLNEIRLEAADVMIYLLSFCETLNIDLGQAVLDKVKINEGRWPLPQSND